MSIQSFIARITGYHKPGAGGYGSRAEALMEGGPKDRRGNELQTMEDYLAGKSDFVSVAIDATSEMRKAFPYGTQIRINFTDKQKARIAELFNVDPSKLDNIPFRLVDTGGAFSNMGTGRLDICSGYSSRTDSVMGGKVSWSVVGRGGPIAPGNIPAQGSPQILESESDFGFCSLGEFSLLYGIEAMRKEQQRKEAEDRKRREADLFPCSEPKK